MHAILNIGLNQSKNFAHKENIDFLTIANDVLLNHGSIVKHEFKTVTHEQGIEETLIILLKLKHSTDYRIECLEHDINKLASELNQDCISICYINGKLIGEYANSWGSFNLDYFHFNA